MPSLNLYDIKELSDIPDNSFVVFVIMVIVLIVLISMIVIFFNLRNKKKKQDLIDTAISQINNINPNETKKSAYIISKYGRVLVQDKRSKKLFDELHLSLDKYKYSQLVPRFEKDIFSKMQIFKESVGM
jgi:cell division protein FtsI/penicillin-binding protein 2